MVQNVVWVKCKCLTKTASAHNAHSNLGMWCSPLLTLNAPVRTAADDSREYFFIVFQKKKDLIFHMKHQALFPLKDISIEKKCRLLQFLPGSIRVKTENQI